MNKQFNVVIPMAGKSSRFSYGFKPFLNLDNRVFIEHVLDSFQDIEVASYNFIIREEQELANSVTKTLKDKLFPHLSSKINVIIIDRETEGPFQTVCLGLDQIEKIDNVLVCDCDHYVDIAPVVKVLNDDSSLDIVIPTWKIDRQDQSNWGKVVVNQLTNSIIGFCEKEIVEETEEINIAGIIGCYYFRSIDIILKSNLTHRHFSDFFSESHRNYRTGLAKIEKAYFFGDPKMAKKAIEDRRKKETVICDVDGVLLVHKNCSNDVKDDNKIIGSAANKIRQWRKDKKLVVLATARPERTRSAFIALLDELGIEYDRLVMGLNPGPRYLINDIKPSNPMVRQSLAINLTRDCGIDDLDLLESNEFDMKINKIFKGNSFSKALLVERDNTSFVRKFIIKEKSSHEHYEKLKRQMEDLQRFYYYSRSLVPKILDFQDNDYCFYFDMEFLENYHQLDSFNETVRFDVLEKVINKLSTDIYCFRKENQSNEFIDEFFNTKIFPKLDLFSKNCKIMNHLINEDEVIINSKKYMGLRKALKEINIYDFNTEYLNPIHGDLTLENILYNENFQDFKLIDLDGSRYVDSCYFDLGKIFQSIVSNYKEWNSIPHVLLSDDLENLTCVPGYFDCDKEKYKNICQQYANLMNRSSWLEVYKKRYILHVNVLYKICTI